MELDLDVSRSPDQRAKHAQASVVRLDAVVHDGRPRLSLGFATTVRVAPIPPPAALV